MTTKTELCPNYAVHQTWVDLFDEMNTVKLFICTGGLPASLNPHQRATVNLLLLKIHAAISDGPVLPLKCHQDPTGLEGLGQVKPKRRSFISELPGWPMQPMLRKAGSKWIHGLDKPNWVLSVDSQEPFSCEFNGYAGDLCCSHLKIEGVKCLTIQTPPSGDTFGEMPAEYLIRMREEHVQKFTYAGQPGLEDLNIKFLQDTTCTITLTPPIHQWLQQVKDLVGCNQ